MNALWDIPELVQLILGFLDQPAQAKSALVCRTFWLQSLPLVWKTVHGLGHLLLLFPEDVVQRELEGYIDVCPPCCAYFRAKLIEPLAVFRWRRSL